MMVAGMITLGLFAGIVGHTLPRAIFGIREEQIRMSGYLNHLVICGYESGSNLFIKALINEVDLETTTVVVFGQANDQWIFRPISFGSQVTQRKRANSRIKVGICSRRRFDRVSFSIATAADAATILSAFTIRAYLNHHQPNHERAKPVFMVAEVLDADFDHLRTAGG